MAFFSSPSRSSREARAAYIRASLVTPGAGPLWVKTVVPGWYPKNSWLMDVYSPKHGDKQVLTHPQFAKRRECFGCDSLCANANLLWMHDMQGELGVCNRSDPNLRSFLISFLELSLLFLPGLTYISTSQLSPVGTPKALWRLWNSRASFTLNSGHTRDVMHEATVVLQYQNYEARLSWYRRVCKC